MSVIIDSFFLLFDWFYCMSTANPFTARAKAYELKYQVKPLNALFGISVTSCERQHCCQSQALECKWEPAPQRHDRVYVGVSICWMKSVAVSCFLVGESLHSLPFLPGSVWVDLDNASHNKSFVVSIRLMSRVKASRCCTYNLRVVLESTGTKLENMICIFQGEG